MSKKATQNWYCTCPGHLRSDTDSDDMGAARSTTAVGAKSKWWPTGSVLKVGFQGGSLSQQNAVKTYAAKWSESANLTFSYPATGPYDIRITFNAGGGAWSYVGTDCRMVGQNSQTMNLGWIGVDVIQHEFGHALGLLHEQQFPGGVCYNEANVIQDLSGPPNNWSVQQIRFNVLDAHLLENVITGSYDQSSIMHYAIPARWTCNGVAIPGGKVISPQDMAFIAQRYPGVTVPPITTGKTLTPTEIADLKNSASAAVAAVNAAQVAVNANQAKIKQILGQ